MNAAISVKDRRQLEERINQAATNQLDWRWFLSDLHSISGSAKVHLSVMDTKTCIPLSMMQFGFDPDFAASHRDHFGPLNPWAHDASTMPVGKVRSTREMIEDDDLMTTEFYQDWVRPQENAMGGGATNLVDDGARRFSIGGIIRQADREELEPKFLDLLKFVAPHLRQAMAVNKMLAGVSLEHHILRESMQPGATASSLLSPDCQLMYANAPAEALITRGDIIRCDHQARLRFVNDIPNQKLGSALFGFANSDSEFHPPFFSEPGVRGKNYICRVIRLGLQDRLPTPFPLDYFASGYTLLLMAPVAGKIVPPVSQSTARQG